MFLFTKIYVQSENSVSTCWQSSEEVGITMKTGKGNRLIIVHSGGEAGFVNNAPVSYTHLDVYKRQHLFIFTLV